MNQKQNLKVVPEVKARAENKTKRKVPDPNDEKAWLLFIDEIEPEHPDIAEELSNPANLFTNDVHPAEKEFAAARRRNRWVQLRDRIFNRDDAQGERAPAKQRWVFYVLGLYLIGAFAFTGFRLVSRGDSEEVIDPQPVVATDTSDVTAVTPDARPVPVPRVNVGRKEPQLSGPQGAAPAQAQRPQPSATGEVYNASASPNAEPEEIPLYLQTQYVPPAPPDNLYVGGGPDGTPPPTLQVAGGVSSPDPSLGLYVGDASGATSAELPGLVVGGGAYDAGAATTSTSDAAETSRTIADTRPMPRPVQGELMPGLESLREPPAQQLVPTTQDAPLQPAARQSAPVQAQPETAPAPQPQPAQTQVSQAQPPVTPSGVSLNFEPGVKVKAMLETGIALLPDAVLPVVAVSEGDWCTEPPCPTVRWVGRAQLDGNPAIQIAFDTLVVEGEARPTTAMALDPSTFTAGLSPRLVDDTPAATQDLVRALAGGASNYADALSQETTVSVVDGVAVTEKTAPSLENFLLGSTAALFATEKDQTAIVRSARVEKGSPLVILYGMAP